MRVKQLDVAVVIGKVTGLAVFIAFFFLNMFALLYRFQHQACPNIVLTAICLSGLSCFKRQFLIKRGSVFGSQ